MSDMTLGEFAKAFAVRDMTFVARNGKCRINRRSSFNGDDLNDPPPIRLRNARSLVYCCRGGAGGGALM